MKLYRLSRTVHRWGSILILLPMTIIFVSGIVLQLKKDVTYIQPPTQQGSGQQLAISFDDILEAAQTVPQAGIASWDDVDRLDVRPQKGIVKVRCKNRWEIQIDMQTGEILQVAVRRSDLIENIHTGSFFNNQIKLWVFFPTGLMLVVIVISGLYLFLQPHLTHRAQANGKIKFRNN